MQWQHLCQGKRYGGIRFRHIESFNRALLGKQVWRLLQNQSSWIFKVLKAKYFPSCSFLEAKLGYRLSLIWKRIWENKSWMREGMIWKIGDRRQIDLWREAWIPTLPFNKTMGPLCMSFKTERFVTFWNLALRNGTLTSLTDFFQRWKLRKLNRFQFVSGRYRSVNMRATKNRCYSVKSGYHYLETQAFKPGSVGLRGEEIELFQVRDCPLAREAWSCFSKNGQWLFSQVTDMFKWLAGVTEKIDSETIEEEFTLLWTICNWQNREVMNGELVKAKVVVEKGMSFLKEFKKSQLKGEMIAHPAPSKWMALENEVYKRRRKVVTSAMHNTAPNLWDAKSMEATAALSKIIFAKDVGLSNIMVEGDALSVITTVNSPDPNLSLIGNIIDDIRRFSKGFQVCQFVHARRQANMVAHILAKATILSRNLCTWIEECPGMIRDVVHNDLV
ncbi:hypothetical protein PTKIN_Ptkin05aG0033800 [Pterospermum kingtungense]